MKFSPQLFFSAGTICLVLAACTGPQVEILDRPVVETETSRALTSSGALEFRTRQTLREEGLLRLYNNDSHAALVELGRRFKSEPTSKRSLALAEMSSDSADILTELQPLDALGRYLDAAWLTRGCMSGPGGFDTETPEGTINKYVSARVARLIRERSTGSRNSIRVEGTLDSWQLSLDQGEGKVDPRSFDILVPASWLKTDGIDWKRVTQDGAGVAMVGHVAKTPERTKTQPFMPEAGWVFPLNTRIEFEGRKARLVVQDLMDNAETPGGVPLESDFSAAVSFVYHGDSNRMSRLEGFFRPAENEKAMGMYSIRPHDPDRIPLILVHGLASRAEAWVPFINLLLAEPVVRERYQIVLFNYPTGIPIAESAANLRDALANYQKHNDPRRSNPQMREMVILGHSMGGIISNAQIRTSGDRVYNSIFTKDLNELGLNEEEIAKLKRLGYFQANPDIDRAILLASPLRGSKFAANRIGQLAANLVRIPFDVVDSVFGQIRLVDGLTDIAQEASQRPRNSVNSLRPDNPILTGFLKSPVRPGVKIHTVVAQRDPNDPIEEGSDGVVAYSSSHLDEAVSEVVVKGADHRSMVNRDETVEEVMRILREHAGVR